MNNINRNIDRGNLAFIAHRRDFNNSRTLEKNNFHYIIENEPLIHEIKFSLIFIIVIFTLFIFFMYLFYIKSKNHHKNNSKNKILFVSKYFILK